MSNRRFRPTDAFVDRVRSWPLVLDELCVDRGTNLAALRAETAALAVEENRLHSVTRRSSSVVTHFVSLPSTR